MFDSLSAQELLDFLLCKSWEWSKVASHLNGLFHLNTDKITAGLRTYKNSDSIWSHVPYLQLQCYVIGIGLQKRPIGSSRHEEAHSPCLTTTWGVVADPLIKTSFNLKKGVWRVTTGVSMLSSWLLLLEGGCYGIQASAVQSALKAHLTHSALVMTWFKSCFLTWLCACFP